jgi:hypothetical protein
LISYIRNAKIFTPKSTDLLYFFYDLIAIRDEIVERERRRAILHAIIVAGGPYDAGYRENIQSAYDTYDRIDLLFSGKAVENEASSFEDAEDAFEAIKALKND